MLPKKSTQNNQAIRNYKHIECYYFKDFFFCTDIARKIHKILTYALYFLLLDMS